MEKFRPQRVKPDASRYKAQKAWIHCFESKKLGVGNEQKKKLFPFCYGNFQHNKVESTV